MAVLGNTLIIALDGTAIAASKNADIDNGCETIEIASASQNQWKKFIAGRREWSVSVDRIVMAASDVGTDLLRVGTTYTLAVMSGSTVIVSGSAICTHANVKTPINAIAKCSLQFKGTDALSTS